MGSSKHSDRAKVAKGVGRVVATLETLDCVGGSRVLGGYEGIKLKGGAKNPGMLISSGSGGLELRVGVDGFTTLVVVQPDKRYNYGRGESFMEVVYESLRKNYPHSQIRTR